MIPREDNNFNQLFSSIAKNLDERGFDRMMIAKLIFYLKPHSLEKAKEYLSIKKGKWGHPMLIKCEGKNKNGLFCEICRGSKKEHNTVINLDKTYSYTNDNLDNSMGNLLQANINNSYSNVLNFDTSFCEDSSIVNKLFDDIEVEDIEEDQDPMKLKKTKCREGNSNNMDHHSEVMNSGVTVIPINPSTYINPLNTVNTVNIVNSKNINNIPSEFVHLGVNPLKKVSTKSGVYEKEYELKSSFQDAINLPSSSENYHFTPGNTSNQGNLFSSNNERILHDGMVISDVNTTRYNFERPSMPNELITYKLNNNSNNLNEMIKVPISRKRRRHSNYLKFQGINNNNNLSSPHKAPNISITNPTSPNKNTSADPKSTRIPPRSKSKLDYFSYIKMKNFQSELSEFESGYDKINSHINGNANNFHYSHQSQHHRFKSKKSRVSKMSKISRNTRRMNKTPTQKPQETKLLKRTKTEKSFKSYRSIKSINKNIVNLNLNINNSRSLQCNNCFISAPSGGNNNFNPIKILECNHSMCVKCIREVLVDKIESKRFEEIGCIECGQTFTKKFVSKYVDEFHLIQYLKYSKLFNNSSNELVRCPILNCQGYGLNPSYVKQLPKKTYMFPHTMQENFNRSKSNRITLRGSELERNSSNLNSNNFKYFIKCEFNHLFCFLCRKEAHFDSVCENINKMNESVIGSKGGSGSRMHVLQYPSRSSSHRQNLNDSNSVNNIVQINSHKFLKKCPNCEYLCEKNTNIYSLNSSRNQYTCLSCKCNFCFICSSTLSNRINSYIHYYSPFSCCYLLSNSSPDSVYIKNKIIKTLRYIFLLLLSLFIAYPIFFLFSSFIILWTFNYYYYGNIVNSKLMPKIFKKYKTPSSNDFVSFTYYITLLIPRITIILSSFYLYSFFMWLNFFGILSVLFSPFYYCLVFTYKKIFSKAPAVQLV